MITLFLLTLFACSTRPQPVNPATDGPIVENVEELSHRQKVELQEEMIKRQEEEKRKQHEEYLRIRQQEHYNILTERFSEE